MNNPYFKIIPDSGVFGIATKSIFSLLFLLILPLLI